MLNFGDDVVFSRIFPIFDRPAKDGDYTDRRIMKNSGVKYGTERPAVKYPKKLDVRFYPEGGYIIAGIPCRIAFEALGRDGSANDCSGIVVERQSDTVVAHMTPTADGRGVFTLLAAEGQGKKDAFCHQLRTIISRRLGPLPQYLSRIDQIDLYQRRECHKTQVCRSDPFDEGY